MKERHGASWHPLETRKVVRLLGVELRSGLTAPEVKQHQVAYGPNRLTAQKRRSEWVRFLLQFHAPLLCILLAAAVMVSGCATDRPPVAATATGYHAGRLPFPDQRPRRPSTNDLATVVAYRDYRDPLIRLNRGIFWFNDKAYRYVLIPAGKGYTWLVPDRVEGGISNVFDNVKTPIYVVNHMLQWEPRAAGRDVLRFGVNTTVGLLGIADPARAWWGLERAETHFDDTLADYGVGYGIYLVLPIFGPSDLRNGLSKVGDYLLNPITYVTEQPLTSGIQSFDYLQDFAPTADQYLVLRRQAKDPYIFFRNLYLQGVQRDADY